MDHHDVTGFYTYRSFVNRPEPAEDFNDIRFGEGQLFLFANPNGSLRGTLAFPADPLAAGKEFMDIEGQVRGWSPLTLELVGRGRPGTAIEAFHYEYHGSLAPSFTQALGQRAALVGTVLRASPHGSAPAGFTASFVAVKRDFLMPKQIPGVGLIPEAITMLADRRHRLQHAVWHTVRMLWHAVNSNDEAVEKIRNLGWWPGRPPFLEVGGLNLENGSGEDFLFMHRKMIQMVSETYAQASKTPPAGWATLPRFDVEQTVYVPRTANEGPAFVFDPEASGYMVPPPIREEFDTNMNDRLMKSPAFLRGVMVPLETRFRSSSFLSSLPLGGLGNLLEWTIHGWMHLRWTHTTYDSAGQPIGRSSLFDIDPVWDEPSNDDLGDFYSSHVHPTFWRLHGWIDDRIGDWARVNAEHVTGATVDGIPWFEADGRLVKVKHPFYWPTGHHGHDHDHNNGADIEAMEEVLEIIRSVVEAPIAPIAAADMATFRKPAKEAFREILLGATDVSRA